jgi:hypothetical protein
LNNHIANNNNIIIFPESKKHSKNTMAATATATTTTSRSRSTLNMHSDDDMQYQSSSSHNAPSVASIDMTGNIIGISGSSSSGSGSGGNGNGNGVVLRTRKQQEQRTGLDSHDEEEEEEVITARGYYDDIVTSSSSSTSKNKVVTRRGFAARKRRFRAKNNDYNKNHQTSSETENLDNEHESGVSTPSFITRFQRWQTNTNNGMTTTTAAAAATRKSSSSDHGTARTSSSSSTTTTTNNTSFASFGRFSSLLSMTSNSGHTNNTTNQGSSSALFTEFNQRFQSVQEEGEGEQSASSYYDEGNPQQGEAINPQDLYEVSEEQDHSSSSSSYGFVIKATAYTPLSIIPPSPVPSSETSSGSLSPSLSSSSCPTSRFFATPASINNMPTIGGLSMSPFSRVDEEYISDSAGQYGMYSGTLDNETQKPHGRGKMVYSRNRDVNNNDVGNNDYDYADLPHRQQEEPVLIFDGQWHKGDWCGFGTLTDLEHGHTYEGGFFDNYKHGYGVLKYSDGRVYDGIFALGVLEGKGHLEYPDGTTYWGHWTSDGIEHGRGKKVFADKSVYDGEFLKGVMHGHGRLTWNDGSWYLGEFMDGEPNGLGMQVLPDGTLFFEGTFSHGKPIEGSSFPTCNKKSDGNFLLYRSSLSRHGTLVGNIPKQVCLQGTKLHW